MKFEWKLITGSAIFLGVIYALYWFTSYEDAGSAMLLFGGSAYLMLGAFLLLQWRRRQNHPRPEDDANVYEADGDGEIGFFPAASMWPAAIALGAIFIALGMVWGTWYFAIGIPLVLGAIIGFSVEAEAGIEAVAELDELALEKARRASAEPEEITT